MANTATQEKKSEAHFWARENRRLYITNGTRKVRFDGFYATLDLTVPIHKEVCEMLKAHRGYGVDFYEVQTQKNTKDQQKTMLAWIRKIVSHSSDGEIDDVTRINGVEKLTALFTDEEIRQMGTSRLNPDIDTLTLEASQNKYIQGV